MHLTGTGNHFALCSTCMGHTGCRIPSACCQRNASRFYQTRRTVSPHVGSPALPVADRWVLKDSNLHREWGSLAHLSACRNCMVSHFRAGTAATCPTLRYWGVHALGLILSALVPRPLKAEHSLVVGGRERRPGREGRPEGASGTKRKENNWWGSVSGSKEAVGGRAPWEPRIQALWPVLLYPCKTQIQKYNY